nr:MAG TPA: hypothetical protein [Caudoviricetes sp.]
MISMDMFSYLVTLQIIKQMSYSLYTGLQCFRLM